MKLENTIDIPLPKIYTSCFRNRDKYMDSGNRFTEISIMEFIPRKYQNYNIKELPILNPSKDLYDQYQSKKIDRLEFSMRYAEQIKTLPVEQLIRIFACLSYVEGSNGVMLLGVKKYGIECHRSVIADMINRSGIVLYKVTEFK